LSTSKGRSYFQLSWYIKPLLSKKLAPLYLSFAQPSSLPKALNGFSLPEAINNNMSTDKVTLPLIDLSGYINPKSPGDKERVITEVRNACAQYGFFQAKGHSIPLSVQRGLLQSIDTLFNMPKEEKRKLSFLENVSRRGYEESGMSLREGDDLPDSKEVRYSPG